MAWMKKTIRNGKQAAQIYLGWLRWTSRHFNTTENWMRNSGRGHRSGKYPSRERDSNGALLLVIILMFLGILVLTLGIAFLVSP